MKKRILDFTSEVETSLLKIINIAETYAVKEIREHTSKIAQNIKEHEEEDPIES